MTEDPTIKETFDTFLEKAGWIESKSDPLLLYTLWYLRFKRFALLSNENPNAILEEYVKTKMAHTTVQFIHKINRSRLNVSFSSNSEHLHIYLELPKNELSKSRRITLLIAENIDEANKIIPCANMMQKLIRVMGQLFPELKE